MRETKVEKALRLGVEALGGTCEKFTTPGKRGVPDRLITWPRGNPNCIVGWQRTTLQREDTSPVGGYIMFQQPRTEFVETKRPKNEGGRLKPWQERDHTRRRARGYEVYVTYTLEEVEAYLRSRGKK